MMVSGTSINGAVVHALLLTRYLSGRGHKILLLHRPGAWIAEQSVIDGVEMFATSFARSPRELIRTARRINRFAPDVVHTHMSSAHAYGMLIRIFSHWPVVATAHSQSIQLHWCFNNIVIATSHAAAKHHRKYNLVRRSALRTQSNFIDTREFPVPLDDERRAMRDALGIPHDAFVIGSVGIIDSRKNQLHLVRALAEIRCSIVGARLLLVGEHNARYFDEIKREADRLGVTGRLICTGERRDVAKVLAAMDIFVLASRKETGPLAVLEAMSRGLPALVTDVGALREFVGNGIAGYTVKVGDIAGIAERLVTMASDPERRSAMGRAAAARVRDNYDIARAGPNIEMILVEAAQTRNRSPLGFVVNLVRNEET